jgi:hypothetical protein
MDDGNNSDTNQNETAMDESNQPTQSAETTTPPTNIVLLQTPRPKSPRPIPENTPSEMATLRQWVMWRYTWKGGKWTKPPYRAVIYSREPDILLWASSTNPITWRTLGEAMAAYDASQLWSNPFDGVGFVFSGEVGDDGLCDCGVDLDDWGEAEQAIHAKLAASYAEVRQVAGGCTSSPAPNRS